MEFLQLHYFLETAQSENIARTAEKFMVPASSVSASIKRLEKELEVNLFDRSANQIKLNEKGYLFAESLKNIFQTLENTRIKIADKKTPPKEICLLIKARRKWISDLVIEYKQSHPEVQFRIFNDVHMEDIDAFDIIIDEQSDKYQLLERFLLSIEEICVKASKDSPLAGQKLSFRQLREQPFIMPRKDTGIRKLLEYTGKKFGFEPNIAIECNDSYCLARYVKAGMGLTLGSHRALQNDIEQDFVALDVTDFNEVQLVYVYHRALHADDAAMKDFCDFLYTKRKKLNAD